MIHQSGSQQSLGISAIWQIRFEYFFTQKDFKLLNIALNHNYNITYGENAAKFVHDIRKRYEVVICYLIGFNNEKKGIPNKTIFANKVDDEWKYLSNYIKLLEKIRSNRK